MNKKNQKQNRLDCNKSSDNDSSLFNWNSGETHSKYKAMTILYINIFIQTSYTTVKLKWPKNKTMKREKNKQSITTPVWIALNTHSHVALFNTKEMVNVDIRPAIFDCDKNSKMMITIQYRKNETLI